LPHHCNLTFLLVVSFVRIASYSTLPGCVVRWMKTMMMMTTIGSLPAEANKVVSLLWRCAGLQCPLHCERRPSGTNEGQLQGLNRLPGFSFGGRDLGTLDRPSQRIRVISNDAQWWGGAPGRTQARGRFRGTERITIREWSACHDSTTTGAPPQSGNAQS
jgi:hypothetical protein